MITGLPASIVCMAVASWVRPRTETVVDYTTADQYDFSAPLLDCQVEEVIGKPEGLNWIKKFSLKGQISTPC
jgi:hypothetical protein